MTLLKIILYFQTMGCENYQSLQNCFFYVFFNGCKQFADVTCSLIVITNDNTIIVKFTIWSRVITTCRIKPNNIKNF